MGSVNWSVQASPHRRGGILTRLNFSSVSSIVTKAERRRLAIFSVLRVLVNGLDIVGIAGIAILAGAFGTFASGGGQAASVQIPVAGELVITEYLAVLIALVVAMVFILKSGFSVLLSLKTALFIAEIESRLSISLADEFFKVSSDSFSSSTSVSEVQNLAMSSTSGIKNFLNSRILFYAEGSLLLSLLVALLFVNPIATLALTSFMAVVLLALNRLINYRLKMTGQRSMIGSRESLQSVRDLHGVKREVVAAGVVDQWINRFAVARSNTANAGAIMLTLNSLPRFVIETSLILGIFVFLGGVVIFSDLPSQAVTIGVFMGAGLRIMASIIPFQSAITGMRSGAATGDFAYQALCKISASQVGEFHIEKSETKREADLIFNNVFFSYGVDEERVLYDVSFHIRPHTKVAIVGPSGAGKSTIFDLAMGFLLPTEGNVLIGGQTARSCLVRSPGFFAIVPQRPHLILGSVLENVSLLPAEETDSHRVKEVLIRSGLKKLTVRDDWQQQELRPDSGHLSGGEIQRLSIARALYTNAKILFLDEATSALDAKTEFELSKVLDDLKHDMTIVLIAHRLSTVKSADNILYVDEGKLVNQGTFSELKANVPEFARAVSIMGLQD